MKANHNFGDETLTNEPLFLIAQRLKANHNGQLIIHAANIAVPNSTKIMK